MSTTQLGRPNTYSTEIGSRICELLSTEERGLKSICNDAGMPHVATVWRWLSKNAEFWDMYAKARDFQTELMYDELEDIINAPLTHNGKSEDEGGRPLSAPMAMAEVQLRKLKVDTIKFKLAKLQPKRFGENKSLSVDVKVRTITSEEQFKELRASVLKQVKAAPEAEDIEHEEL